MATLDYDKIINGIRKALYGYEVREYIAKAMEWVKSCMETSVETITGLRDEANAAKDAAKASQDAAKTSETNAKASADSMGTSVATCTTKAKEAKASEEAAAKSEAAAKASKEAAEKSAELAGTRAGTDKTLSIENAPADAAVVGRYILDQTKDPPELVFYSKAEVEAKIKEILAAQREEDYKRVRYWVSDDPTSPASFIGGTWERVEGEFILGASDAYPAGSTGGEAEVTLIEDQLPVIDGTWMCPVPNNHADSAVTGHAYGYDHITSLASWWGSGSDNIRWGYGYKFGGGMPHNNLPPYYSMYIWRRVA